MNRLTLADIDLALKHRLVVSCQPVDNGPMDDDMIVATLARAAIAGGAGGVRIEGSKRLAAVREKLTTPIIGIVKRDLSDSPVRITPFIEDIHALAKAGADIIAVDGTKRIRPVSIQDLLAEIKNNGVFTMADCSNLADATAAIEMGFDIVGTTLSGYTVSTTPTEPDYDLLTTLATTLPNARIMAEGRFNRPDQVARALKCGAWAVTVGTAITRTEVVTSWFVDALKRK
jgi:N-acylglucosamine-6-phosphate 2-epimerase